MSMYNDIVWREKGNEELRIAKSKIVAEYARTFCARTLVVSYGVDQKRHGTALTRANRMENGIVSLRT